MKPVEHLDIYCLSKELANDCYDLTEGFPAIENYSLVRQIRRASYSLFTNISEGYNRDSTKEFLRFLSIVNGSAAELQSLLSFANDRNFITQVQYKNAYKKIKRVRLMNYSLVKKLKAKLS